MTNIDTRLKNSKKDLWPHPSIEITIRKANGSLTCSYLEELYNKIQCIQNVYRLDTQVRLGKVKKVKEVSRLNEPKNFSSLDALREEKPWIKKIIK